MLEKQRTPLARFIEENANRSGHSFEEIGIMCGFKTANLIHSFTRGEIRLPLDKVAPMAEALGCDASQLFNLALKEWFSPQIVEQVEQALVTVASLDTAEAGWLAADSEMEPDGIPIKYRTPIQYEAGQHSD